MIANIVKKVQAELEQLGLVASEYRINEINGDGSVLTFDHDRKIVRVGASARLVKPSVSFLQPATMVSFIAPVQQQVPSFI